MMSSFMTREPDFSRYERQMLPPEMGLAGQKRLAGSRVLIAGAGGLGSPAALYLAGAGVGTLGIVDSDAVELSNLHRQVLHTESRQGMNKARSAGMTLREINRQVRLITYPFRLTGENAAEILTEYDFVIMAVDNFETRFLINDICVREGIPFCHGGIIRYEGQVMTWVPGQGPCYRCIFGEAPEEGTVPTSSQAGVIGPAVGVIGSLQALEAMKYLTGAGQLLTGRILLFDGLTMKMRTARFPKAREDCPACKNC